MVTITDDGIEWYGDLATGEVTTPLDTIAVGTGTDVQDPAASSLQSETYRAAITDSIVEFVPAEGDNTVTYATITLRGGLELPAGTEITEVGVLSSGTDPDTLVWYGVMSPIPFDADDENEIRVPMDLTRVVE